MKAPFPSKRSKFAHSPFLDIAQDTRQLIAYMRGVIGTEGRRDDIADLWAPLLVDSLANEKADIRQRLHRLVALIRAEPFFPGPSKCWPPA